jgi:hypothetical protein
VLNELVLVIPSVIAFLGDNPMQSEIACHVGMMGKFFCRTCRVKGYEGPPKSQQATAGVGGMEELLAGISNNFNELGDADAMSADGGESDNSTGSHQPQKRGRKKALESLDYMVSHIKRFVGFQVNHLCTKEQTKDDLRSLFILSHSVGNLSSIQKEKTEKGLKDTYLDYFLDKISSSYANVRGLVHKQQALDQILLSIPSEPYSPVWRIKGFDPHSDTPVEILHVILLGFVKYFWRDVVNNQIKKNSQKRELLIARLSSVNVSGLGLSPLPGHTLVQYAGSLTGRDFRAICQVAPFVIYDLVPPECYAAWVSLSSLIPIIWQPIIPDIDHHVTKLHAAIQHFLSTTAQWTPRWFNKPKFHILLHLPDHIRRFGPATLFATEGFESFNAVICAKSIHSNHQAPSHDIAISFAHANRIRHMLSGGQVLFRKDDDSIIAAENQWRKVGDGLQGLVAQSNVITHYLGFDSLSNETMAGMQVMFHYSNSYLM